MERIEEKTCGEKPFRVAVSAGELSGDEHAAELVTALRRLLPHSVFSGMGGRHLLAAGVELKVNSEEQGSVMGFQEVLSSFRKIYGAFAAMQRLLREWKPDVLVLVDFPDFNLRLAKYAKTLGIKVFYYITPQVWAWRASRVRAFERYVDRAACIFPFERSFFEAHGYARAHYVGHPFASRYHGLDAVSKEEKQNLRERMGLRTEAPTICFFPGSRPQEIRRHESLVKEVWKILKTVHPDTQAVIALAGSVHSEELRGRFAQLSDVAVLSGDAISALRVADAGMIKSGTSNLQAAYCALPFCMFFITSPLSAFVAGRVVKIKEYSIVNIIRSGTVREILQKAADAKTIARELELLLFDDRRRQEVLKGLEEVRHRLSSADSHPGFAEAQNAAERAAILLLGCVDN